MPHRNQNPWILLIFILISLACGTAQPTPIPQPTATITTIPTNILIHTETPKPTQTPDIEATQRTVEFNAEAQGYFEKGYLTDPDGGFTKYEDYFIEWAQLGSYGMNKLDNKVSDFFMSAHFIWESAYRNADTSGCGFAFAIQDNNEHYAVFLDRSKVYFVEANPYYSSVGLTRGTGHVKFDNPADKPVEADFTLIVKGAYAYVLVNNELVGEYTLTQSRSLYGNIGLTVLSGTNKDYGTRCLMTDMHLWTPEED
ncbi:MAG: hypothetical protein H7Y59_19765 [Anaerolineales bacterium]|nr:hypothetical protein [Anaerolineales bacterium]